jgi:hypothetical protein
MYKIIQKLENPDLSNFKEKEIATCESLKYANLIKDALENYESSNSVSYKIENPEERKPTLEDYQEPFESISWGSWDITVVRKYEDGSFLVCDALGSTQHITPDQIETYKENKIKRQND